MAPVLWWYASISLTGLAALPLTCWLLERLPGRGFAFARPLGLLLACYLLWIGASLRILPNNPTGVLISLLVMTGISFTLGSPRAVIAHLREHTRWWLASELLFALAFLGWAVLRAYAVDKVMPAGGEKYMEMAFFNAVLHSPSFPPTDPWLSGLPISYYYFGYVMMDWMAQLTRTSAGIAFDLYDALLFALTVQAAFGLASEAAALSALGRTGKAIAGAAAAFFLAGMGNLEGLLEALNARGWLPQAFSTWLAIPGFPLPGTDGSFYPGSGWWWWRASRVIQDVDLHGAAIPASPITEFPFFSFLLGDNHPHVLALPFALLSLAVALEWFTGGPRRSLVPARLGFAALVMGSLLFLNTWDFPVYAFIALCAFFLGAWMRGDPLPSVLRESGLRLVFLALGAILLFLPFLPDFHSQAAGLLPYIFPPTRFAQYSLLFAPFLLIFAGVLAILLRREIRAQGSSQPLRQIAAWWLRLMLVLGLFFFALLVISAIVVVFDQFRGGQMEQAAQPWLGGMGVAAGLGLILFARPTNPLLFLTLSLILAAGSALLFNWIGKHRPPDRGLVFALLLGLAGFALTFAPEFLYLRDNFGVRMNTIFKFYFQAETLLACACGLILAWVWKNTARARIPFVALVLLLAAAGLVYPLEAIYSRTAGFTAQPTLDATANLRRDQPDEWAAIDWLAGQVRPGTPAVLLEAPCPSYCTGGRMSAFSGIPAVLGWFNHEAQWRGSSIESSRRAGDISAMYATASDADTLRLLRQWKVTYVIFGAIERSYIAEICKLASSHCSVESSQEKLQRLLSVAFQSGDITLFYVPP